jgi:hypothetical protein
MTAEKDNGSLLTAILAVQGEVGTLFKDKVATVPTKSGGQYQYRYIALDAIVEQVGPILNKHGLIWMTFPTGMGAEAPSLRYVLQHAATGEEVSGVMPLMLGPNQTPQGMGSALTYARRYSLCAVLNLVADDDDDAQASAQQQQKAGAAARAKANMGEEERTLLAEAEALYEAHHKDTLPQQRFDSYRDSTGYNVEGLQRLVDWLNENKPKPADA